MSNVKEIQEYLVFAESLAHKAGEMMQAGQRDGFTSRKKGDGTDVTVIDEAINQMVIEAVAAKYPDHGVYGEEGRSTHTNAKHVWVCDPIDGTVMFMRNIPTSSFSLALTKNGEPIVAVVNNPWEHKLYSAVKGQGTMCNGKKISVSQKAVLPGALMGFTTWTAVTADYAATSHQLCQAGTYIVDFGAIVHMCTLVAEGKLDGIIFPGRHAHDVAAAALLVSEAGGKVTDLLGKTQRYDGRINGCLLTNSKLHTACLGLLKCNLGAEWEKYASS